jgi:hypothetical protein
MTTRRNADRRRASWQRLGYAWGIDMMQLSAMNMKESSGCGNDQVLESIGGRPRAAGSLCITVSGSKSLDRTQR